MSVSLCEEFAIAKPEPSESETLEALADGLTGHGEMIQDLEELVARLQARIERLEGSQDALLDRAGML